MDPRISILAGLLEGYRSDVQAAYESVPQNLLDVKSSDSGWSAANVIEHLATTERNVSGLISNFLAGADIRTDEEFDETNFRREIDMPFFLNRTTPIRGSQPTGALSGSEAWEALMASRVTMMSTLEAASLRRLETFSRLHPATGNPLNGYQWLAFIALHEGRHAAQIAEIQGLVEDQVYGKLV